MPRLSMFLAELKRRKVYRVAAVYVAVGMAVIAVGDGAVPEAIWDQIQVPVSIALLLGFPIALVLAWAYEVRPEEPAPSVGSPARESGEAREAGVGKSQLDVSAGTQIRAEDHALGTPGEPRLGIVVLPFENLSPNPDNAFFADGLTEEIISDLSKVRALRVISRTSAMAFKGTAKTVPAIAEELNVRFVLEGSVRREAESLRITAQLIDAESDDHLWAEEYAGALEDVFDLQEQLSRRIVDGLKVRLSPDEDRRLAARPFSDIQAHDIWLRARQQVLTMSSGGIRRARDLVEQALDLAGDNALLHATLSWIHAVRFVQIVEGAEEALSLAREHAKQAVNLDPELPWSLFAMAAVHLREGDIQGFAQWGKRVLEIEQDSHALAVLALYLSEAGRVAPARRYAEEAASLDPLSFLTTHAGPFVEVRAGKADTGFPRMKEIAERLAPGEQWPAFEVGYAALQAGQEDEAVSWLRKSAEGGSPFYSGMSRLLLLVIQDEPGGAEEVLGSEEFLSTAGRVASGSHLVAGCFAMLGREEEALAWLGRAVEQGFTNHRFLGEHDRLLESLRGTSPFDAILAKARRMEANLEV